MFALISIFNFLPLSLSRRLPYSFSSSVSCLPSFSLYHSEGRRTIHKEEDKGVREKTEEAERESEQCRRRTRARRKERQKPREKVRRKDKTGESGGKRGGDAENSRKCLALCVCSFFVLILSHCPTGDKPGRACGEKQKRSILLITHLVPFLSHRSFALLSLSFLPGGKLGVKKEGEKGKDKNEK